MTRIEWALHAIAKEFAISGSQMPEQVVLSSEEFDLLLCERFDYDKRSGVKDIRIETPWGALQIARGCSACMPWARPA